MVCLISMFLEPYIVIIVLLITMVLFLWGRWRYDIVALIALSISVILGAVPLNQVYSGLGNPAVITVACVMVISQTIIRSGILNRLIDKLSYFSKYTMLHICLLSILTAILSAFMNNIGALAIIMPIAIKTSIENKRSPSVILMPLALASALGGLITMIGTPPNLLISTYRQEITGHPFAMFDFSPVGICIALLGCLFIILIGWRLIPERKAPMQTEDLFQIQGYITELKIPAESPAIGTTIGEIEKKSSCDFVILGRIRNKKKQLILNANSVLEKNDILMIEASTEELNKLINKFKLELTGDKKIGADELKTEDVSLMEAVIPQNSRAEGRSSQQIRLRSRYNMNLLAIAREGKAFKHRLNHTKLKAGDVLLLQGNKSEMDESLQNLGLLPLISRNVEVNKKRNPYLGLVIFTVAILFSALQLLPVQIAFSAAVLMMVLFKVIKPRELYEGIEWPIIVLLAAMIPIGNALQSTGGTGLITHYLINISGGISPTFILVILLALTMTLSDFMNNAATTIVMAPIAVGIAEALKVNVDPFLMTVAIGASCSFLTPIGHQNNTLVLGPGGYKFTDYIRIGLPLEIIILAVSVPLILWIWPLN
jgi:di/tricarboxylate transporter